MSLSKEEDPWSSSDEEDGFNNKDNIVHGLDPNFVECITNVKRQLYNEIILKPPSNSKNAQQLALLNRYNESLKKIHDMINDIQNKRYNPEDIKQFPLKAQESVRNLIEWIDDFCKNNSNADMIPYDFYTHCCLVVHPNIQKKELPCIKDTA